MKRILIVDDEAEVAATLAKMVQSQGYEAIGVTSATAALGQLVAQPADVVITDIQMPDMTGLDLFNRIKIMNIPVIFMSGFSADMNNKEAARMGASDYLAKPFSHDDLLNAIEIALNYKARENPNEVENQDTNYCRVHIQDFISGSKSNLDVYVRISPEKYLRVARAESPLSVERLQSYLNKGLQYLYIHKEAFAGYVGFNLKLIKAVNQGKVNIPASKKMSLVRQATEVYLENTFVNGLDKEGFDHAKVLVESAVQLSVDSNTLFEILESLRDHHDIVYAHSLGVAVFSTMIARQIGWTGGPTSFKVALAGLFHDIGKRELPKNLASKSKLEMSYEEIHQYESHCSRGRDLLRDLPFISEEIVQAVAQHHENNLGHGFPLGLTRAKIHPIAKILHLADVFCHLVMKGPTGKGIAPALAIDSIYKDREAEFEPILLRALFELIGLEVPEKLQKASSLLDSTAKPI